MAVPYLNIKSQFEEIYPEVEKGIKGLFEDCKFILGPYVEKFETRFSEVMGTTARAAGVASGTDALMLALKAINLKSDEEVIVPAYTFIATADAVIHAGGKPVFADIMKDYPTLDIESVKSKITKKTRAIIPVHLYGEAANMDAIMKLAKEHNLVIVEDVAQATALNINGKIAGTIGDFGAFSFYPTKNLPGAGDGGMVLINNPEYVKPILYFRDHGRLQGYTHDVVGYNSRLDAIQAIVLSANIERLESRNNQRITSAKKYNELFKNTGLKLPVPQIKDAHVYNLYTLRSPKRDHILSVLKEKNIGCGIYYPIPLHLQPCLDFLGYKEGDFPVTEQWSKEVFSIPCFPGMTDAQVEEVADAVKSAL